jgi:hypothetical protein
MRGVHGAGDSLPRSNDGSGADREIEEGMADLWVQLVRSGCHEVENHFQYQIKCNALSIFFKRYR